LDAFLVVCRASLCERKVFLLYGLQRVAVLREGVGGLKSPRLVCVVREERCCVEALSE
jgi:hypothetical protein